MLSSQSVLTSFTHSTRHFVCMFCIGWMTYSLSPSLVDAKSKHTRIHKQGALHTVYWRSLVYRLRWPNTRLQRRIGREFRRRQERRAIPYILGMLHKKKWPQRQKGALIALGQLGLRWSIPTIFQYRMHPVLAVRLASWEAFARLCAQRSCNTHSYTKLHKHFVALLLRKIGQGTSLERKQALWSLSALEATEALARLQKLYKAPRKTQGLGLYFSRTLATLGDTKKRTIWKDLQTKRPHWVRMRLAHWPGRWSAHVLRTGLLGATTTRQRKSWAKHLLYMPSSLRVHILSSLCSSKQLSTTFCTRHRRILKTKRKQHDFHVRPWFLSTQEDIQKQHQQIHQTTKNFTQKIEQVSAQMLGTPYLLDPLGEGHKGRYDKNPIFSFKRVDCVTFVEQVMGLAHTASFPKVIPFTQSIRYRKGRIDYSYRRHLPIAQWIPAMIRKGFGKDVTHHVGGSQTKTLIKRLNRMSYSTREGQRLVRRLGAQHVVYGTFRLPYLPLNVALQNLRRIPSGTVLSSLRNANPYSPGQVTHQGLIIRSQGQLVMRHASSQSGAVVDVPLRTYLLVLQKYPRPRIGIHLLKLTLPAAR